MPQNKRIFKADKNGVVRQISGIPKGKGRSGVGQKTYDKEPLSKRTDEHREKARDKMAEHLVNTTNMSSEEAHACTAELARESERKQREKG